MSKELMKLRDFIVNWQNWFFAGSQLASGVLHYAFQVLAAKQLPLEDFGQWSGWFAAFSLSLFVGIWAQSLTAIKRDLILPSSGSAIAVAIALIAMTGGGLALDSLVLLSFSGWAWTIAMNGFTGLALARRELVLIAVAGPLMALTKFAIVAALPTYFGYQLAIILAAIPSVFIFLVYYRRFLLAEPSQQLATATNISGTAQPQHLVLFVALAFALITALVPQLDLLVAREVLDAEAMGRFAQISLIYKAFFFGFLILAQILMSYQVRGGDFQFSRQSIIAAFLILLAVSGGVGAAVPWPGMPFGWVSAALVHIVSLTFIFFFAQKEAAQQRWLWPTVWAAVLMSELVIFRVLALEMTVYLALAVLVESFSLAVFLFSDSKRKVF